MRRRGDRREAVPIGDFNDVSAQAREILMRFLYVVADFGADFDLRKQQLRRYLRPAGLLGLGHQGLRRVDNEASRLFVDQADILLLRRS